jgi:ketosteroid isomerase-like protein
MPARELVLRAYDAWERLEGGDETAAIAFGEIVHPDFVYEPSGLFPGFDERYVGVDGMLRFARQMLESWTSFEIDLQSLAEEEERVLAELRFRARGVASGIEVDLPFAHGWHLRDGLIDHLIAQPSAAGVRARWRELGLAP